MHHAVDVILVSGRAVVVGDVEQEPQPLLQFYPDVLVLGQLHAQVQPTQGVLHEFD